MVGCAYTGYRAQTPHTHCYICTFAQIRVHKQPVGTAKGHAEAQNRLDDLDKESERSPNNK